MSVHLPSGKVSIIGIMDQSHEALPLVLWERIDSKIILEVFRSWGEY